jgi:hypothetical protein
MLRSPVPSAAACSRSTSVQKPLPSPPCSASPELPVELPGSLLLENQGFPSGTTPVSARPITQIFRRGTHPTDQQPEHKTDPLDLLNLVPVQLIHARSVPDLRSRHSKLRSLRSGNALNSSTAAKPSPPKMQHKKSLSETGSRRRPRHNLLASPSSTDITSMTLEPPVSTSRDSNSYQNSIRVDARRLSQQAQGTREERAKYQNLETHRSNRNEVSVVGFLANECLLVA